MKHPKQLDQPIRTSLVHPGASVEAPVREGNGKARRLSLKLRRRFERARIKRRLVEVVESDIPVGSVLSTATIEAIRGGEYRFLLPPPPPTQATPTYAQKLKRRAKANRLKRAAECA